MRAAVVWLMPFTAASSAGCAWYRRRMSPLKCASSGLRNFDLLLPADHRGQQFGEIAGGRVLEHALGGLLAQGQTVQIGLFVMRQGGKGQLGIGVHGSPGNQKTAQDLRRLGELGFHYAIAMSGRLNAIASSSGEGILARLPEARA